ncbi:class I adenylate-forming enzyme family protein [Pseudaquabacterium pictum]|uniref:Ligase n=1 Tax=Pseudaquabacterium pictum TaxID=2315236 RepID=A0A480ASE8_9BURK|nr:class I adenylate-forming enzyme family protein [Rubrivivax pictus]GCL63866.1 ligase [Rubrivivax pictus]
MSDRLGAALLQACRQFSGAVALQAPAAQVSYRALADQASAAAAQLRAAGLQADEPVLVMVSNQPGDVAALLAVWLAGGVVVAVHRSTPQALLTALQQRTGARLGLDWPDASAAPALQRWAATPPRPRPLLDSAAFIIFTSGSTGQPKGVVLTHAAFGGKLQQIDGLLQFQPTDRTLLVLNLSFGFGLWVALLTLLRGGTLVMAASFDAAGFLATLARERITQVGLVPTMMRMVLTDPSLAPAIARVVQQGSLRQMLIGGELLGLSLAATLRQQFSGTQLIDIYGLTETSTCDFFAFPADAAQRPGCIGRPSPQVQHRIADAAGAPVAPGAVGELQLRSPFLLAGYLDAPDLTAAAFQDGWFRTGDLARQHADGLVELMGRQKELISRGGHKLTPVEVEQALSAHPDVAAAMVTGVADAVLGERIHVLVVPRSGTALTVAALRQHLAGRLEKFKHPDAWHVADALPLGRTGKADRGALGALIAAGQTRPLDP